MANHRSRAVPIVSRPVTLVLATVALLLLCAALAVPAFAHSSYRHGTATSKSACVGGCHSGSSSNTMCTTSCHPGFKVEGSTRWCWDCHTPGQSTLAWRNGACTGACHAATVHAGAGSKTCVTCHRVSASATDPGSSPHHDGVVGTVPSCQTCHDGKTASLQTSHAGIAACTSCHNGMDRPVVPAACLACHSSAAHSEAKQIAYTNDLSCADARCHGSAVIHGTAPALTKTCTDCHAAHYQALGTCTACHKSGAAYHHGTARAVALADCVTCHDGSVATARAGHQTTASCTVCHTAGMTTPDVPAVCITCHDVGSPATATCLQSGCHTSAALHSRQAPTPADCTAGGCHTAHFQAIATCTVCHTDRAGYHHRGVKATPLAACSACHDGSVAAAKQAHSGLACASCHTGMDRPAQPATCRSCHDWQPVGTAACTTCHSVGGSLARDQAHSLTPGSGTTCTTCHRSHYADLGACKTCHGAYVGTHHRTTTLTDARLTLSARPAKVRPGARATIAGVLRTGSGAVAGQGLLIQGRRLPRGAFKTVASVRTRAGGRYGLSVQPVAGMEYRVVWRPAGAFTLRSRPAVVTVGVRMR